MRAGASNAAKHYTNGLRREAAISGLAAAKAHKVLGARVYATRAYTAETTNSQKRVTDLVSRANDTLGVEIGARVELATNEPWQPAGSPELPALLEQLTRRDPGAGADLVIGLAGSPPTLVFNFHELGVAHSDGDHKG